MVAELRRSIGGSLKIEIYATESQAPWSFDLASWLSVLAEAQRKLG